MALIRTSSPGAGGLQSAAQRKPFALAQRSGSAAGLDDPHLLEGRQAVIRRQFLFAGPSGLISRLSYLGGRQTWVRRPFLLGGRQALIVGVLAALMLGEIAHTFQFREFFQQLFLNPFFERVVHH